jgi:hypothetical protein
VKNHSFFKGVDWVKMKNLMIDPPFRPRVRNEEDITNFEKLITDEKIQESITSNLVGSGQFIKFDDFTYNQSPKFEMTEEVKTQN